MQLKNLRSCEAEVKQLRGLTNDQNLSIAAMRQQIQELKTELANATKKLEEEIQNCQELKRRHEQ